MENKFIKWLKGKPKKISKKRRKFMIAFAMLNVMVIIILLTFAVGKGEFIIDILWFSLFISLFFIAVEGDQIGLEKGE